MPDLFLFLVGVLAVYRLSVLLTVDDGPGDWCLWLRTIMGAYDYERDPTPLPSGVPMRWRARTNVGRAMSCPRCLSIWLALPVAVALFWHTGLWVLPVWFALSGGAVWLWEVTQNG